jgi:short subunit dehydrogenase-like uncharacterized protein
VVGLDVVPTDCLAAHLAERLPDADARAEGESHVWGEVRNGNGERVLDGDFEKGFQTPAGAYGPDLILDIEGVEREDVV